MSEPVPSDSSSEKTQHPLSQAGLSSLIIGVSALTVPDQTVQEVIALLSPVVSYFTVRFIQRRRKKDKLERLCTTIDQMIVTLQTEKAQRSTSKIRKKEIDDEIGSLRKKRQDSVLADVDIKLTK